MEGESRPGALVGVSTLSYLLSSPNHQLPQGHSVQGPHHKEQGTSQGGHQVFEGGQGDGFASEACPEDGGVVRHTDGHLLGNRESQGLPCRPTFHEEHANGSHSSLGGLLRLQGEIQKTDSHMDKLGVESTRNDWDREMRGQVRRGEVHHSQQVGARVRDGTAKLASSSGARQVGSQGISPQDATRTNYSKNKSAPSFEAGYDAGRKAARATVAILAVDPLRLYRGNILGNELVHGILQRIVVHFPLVVDCQDEIGRLTLVGLALTREAEGVIGVIRLVVPELGHAREAVDAVKSRVVIKE